MATRSIKLLVWSGHPRPPPLTFAFDFDCNYTWNQRISTAASTRESVPVEKWRTRHLLHVFAFAFSNVAVLFLSKRR
jgi:hypothetical protein